MRGKITARLKSRRTQMTSKLPQQLVRLFRVIIKCARLELLPAYFTRYLPTVRQHVLLVSIVHAKTLATNTTNQRFLDHVLLHVTANRLPVLETLVAVIISKKFVSRPRLMHVVDVLVQVIASNEAFIANATLISALMLIEIVLDLEGLFAFLACVCLRV